MASSILDASIAHSHPPISKSFMSSNARHYKFSGKSILCERWILLPQWAMWGCCCDRGCSHSGIHIVPYPLDFAVEVYVAWILLHIRYKQACQDGHWHTQSQTYRDSQSYISALESQSEQTTAILRDLIADCRKLASQFRLPTHLFSHKKGMYLDEVLDAVDSCAKDTALIQEAQIGWIHPLQKAQPIFTFQGRQIHNFDKNHFSGTS